MASQPPPADSSPQSPHPPGDVPPIVVAGNVVLDMFPALVLGDAELTDLLIGGQVIEAGPLLTRSGGAVANTGISLHRLGVPVIAIGAVADDLFGGELRAIFRREGLSDAHLRTVSGTSSYTIVLAPPGTDRIFLHYPGPSQTFSAADVDWQAVASAGIFHLGYPSLLPALYAEDGAPLAALLQRVKSLGVTTSVDLSMVPRGSHSAAQDWPAILARVMPYVDIFLPSLEETLFFLRRDLYAALSAAAGREAVLTAIEPEHAAMLGAVLIEMGVGVVALKAGARGMYLRSGSAARLATFGRVGPGDSACWADRELWEPGFQPRRIATATGAGDAAVAGFLAAFARGHNPDDALRYACALGAQNLEAVDATSSIRSWPETTAMVEGDWPHNTLKLDDARWRYDPAAGQWRGPHDRDPLASEAEP
jgi:sugar/nucleoside kinase (ribokinase family)